jgi:hypothetical protein
VISAPVAGLIVLAIVLTVGGFCLRLGLGTRGRPPRQQRHAVIRLRELHARRDAGELTDEEFVDAQWEILRESDRDPPG